MVSVVNDKAVVAEALKQRPEVGDVLRLRGADDQNVVQINEHESQTPSDLVHQPLECLHGVL